VCVCVCEGRLREMEVMANSAFDAFRDMYYMGGYSSVYFWDLDEGFASCWLIKKASDPTVKIGNGPCPPSAAVRVQRRARVRTCACGTGPSRRRLGRRGRCNAMRCDAVRCNNAM
jgi:hypothetical protein